MGYQNGVDGMMGTSKEFVNLMKARLRAQKLITPVIKDKTNAFNKSRYATVDAIIQEVLPHLTEAGLVLTQGEEEVSYVTQGEKIVGKVITVYTLIVHAESGEWQKNTVSIPCSPDNKMNSAQQVGSALTYGRRYSLAGALGIALEDDDDDGHTAEGKRRPNQKSAYQARKDGDFEALEQSISKLKSVDECMQWPVKNKAKIDALPDNWKDHVFDTLNTHRDNLFSNGAA